MSQKKDNLSGEKFSRFLVCTKKSQVVWTHVYCDTVMYILLAQFSSCQFFQLFLFYSSKLHSILQTLFSLFSSEK